MMLPNSTPRFHEAVNRNARYQNLVLICCVLFGVAMIANTQSPADGGWFWCAAYLRSGKRLYSDMHLALQPLFVLETAQFIALLGKGWLVSKIPALLHLVAYCFGLLLLARHSSLPDRQKALILGCAFFISVAFEAYRFDDYHVLADCFLVYSIVLLLMLQKSVKAALGLVLVVGLGILAGLSLTTRLNDGAALVVGVAISIFCLAPSRRLVSIALFGLVSILTIALIVHLTGDSSHDYAMYSIFKAAGSKGGASNVLLYPLQLPWNALRSLSAPWYVALNLYGFGVAAVCLFLFHSPFMTGQHRRLMRVVLLMLLVLLPLRIHHLYRGLFLGDFTIALSAIGIPVAYILGVLVFVRFIRRQFLPQVEWNRREILILIPLGQLASASMSSGGHHVGLYQPLAAMMLILPFASPIHVRKESTRSFLLVLVTLMACSCAVYKIRVPYFWHSYREKPMFVGRQWYHHPVYGPMIIDIEQLNLFDRICDQVGTDSQVELLSLPFSYANYFCVVAPWHGYVQTFFDTSSKETVFGLMQELQQAPPKWVLYQRQLDNLELHENTYNQGKPLPHRYLDQMIEQKIDSGKWETAFTSTYEERPGWMNEWILIRTRP
jgi:hypothetical protein